MKFLIRRILLSAFLLSFSAITFANPPEVPENIYQWVQSSSRMNYFFNKDQISYAVDSSGKIDLNVIVVPVVKTYDAVQIADVIEKRRWRMLPVDHYAHLAGEANYIRIDTFKGTVSFDALDYLDISFGTIDRVVPEKTVELSSLSEKSRDGIFYRAIIDYANKHEDELISHSKGELRPEDRERIEKRKAEAAKSEEEKQKALEKEQKEEAKRIEKERKAEEKRLAKERKEEEKRLAREKKERELAEHERRKKELASKIEIKS